MRHGPLLLHWSSLFVSSLWKDVRLKKKKKMTSDYLKCHTFYLYWGLASGTTLYVLASVFLVYNVPKHCAAAGNSPTPHEGTIGHITTRCLTPWHWSPTSSWAHKCNKNVVDASCDLRCCGIYDNKAWTIALGLVLCASPSHSRISQGQNDFSSLGVES